MNIPRATYRFQFNEHFRLVHAEALVPYLHDLGVSHIYASPLCLAHPHSPHGYDVCDYGRLNPEIGTEAELERLANALHSRGMNMALDLVPNHMGIASPQNSWWWDVLENGESSRYADCFDIEWRPSDKRLTGKVVVPVLGDEYEAVLKRGELKVLREQNDFVLGYHEHRFPLARISKAQLPADPKALEEFDANITALDKLVQRQHYHLEFHRDGDSNLNYRRFFAISTLAGVRVEDKKVFEATHALILRWLRRGWIDGLRIDHPDGLRDPEGYLRRLRELAPNAWIVVEKILCPGEEMPARWPVAGTTGYDFLNQANGLLVNSAAEKALTDLYAGFTGEPAGYEELVREKKLQVLETILASEWERLASLLAQVAAGKPTARKFARNDLKSALAEMIACFSVYRTYLPSGPGAATPADAAVIEAAVKSARRRRPDLDPSIFTFVQALFASAVRRGKHRDFVARFQQLTGPVMAKGVEDTAFYCFNRFISLNEVGGNPGRFGESPAAVHEFLKQAQKTRPYSLLATSTHDTKRSEDVRARLDVLSEIPEQWRKTVERWSAMNACHRSGDFPDKNAEYAYYQTLAGAWPVPEERVQACLAKSANEAGQHTAWTNRNEPYEKALRNFISETFRDPEFTTDLEKFVGTIADAAVANSLAQTLVKLTAPGVPDIYQGCELWDRSLVDPDNRRPVDYDARQRLLSELKSLPPEAIWERRAEGLPKLWIIQKALRLRARLPRFADFDYVPVPARGGRAENVFAFARGGKVLTIVSRLTLSVHGDWQDTQIALPGGTWEDVLAGREYANAVGVKELLNRFPVALLVRKENA